jgi:hypothetical protein
MQQQMMGYGVTIACSASLARILAGRPADSRVIPTCGSAERREGRKDWAGLIL